MTNDKNVMVSIIIINYRTKELTENCIHSIQKVMGTERSDYEIILVDNASEDGSCEYFQKKSYSNVKLVCSEKNGGFAYGNNLGVKYASGEFLFFLNSDTILYCDIITEMCSFMRMMPEVGVMSCLMDDREHVVLQSSHPYENLKSLFFQTVVKPILPDSIYKKWRENKSGIDKPQQFKEGGWVSGAAMLIPRELFLKVNGWNEKFFMYMEDEELCYRIQQQGKKTMVYQKLGLQHLVGASGGSAFSAYQRYKSKFLYFSLIEAKGKLWIRHLLYFQAKQYMKNLSKDERKKVLQRLKELEK